MTAMRTAPITVPTRHPPATRYRWGAALSRAAIVAGRKERWTVTGFGHSSILPLHPRLPPRLGARAPDGGLCVCPGDCPVRFGRSLHYRRGRPRSAPMPQATINGFVVYYEAAGAAPPLVFVHGGFASLASRLSPPRAFDWSWEH